MSSVPDDRPDSDSRLTKALFNSCVHEAVRLKSNRLSSSSADTTRVTSAARVTVPTSSVSKATTAHDIILKVAPLKELRRR